MDYRAGIVEPRPLEWGFKSSHVRRDLGGLQRIRSIGGIVKGVRE